MANLKVGSRGTAVKQLQARLGVAQDGIFGPKTKAALIAYQRAHGLAADGIYGPKTAAVMNGQAAAPPPPAPAATAPAPAAPAPAPQPSGPTGFDLYYQKAMGAYQPAINSETNAYKARLADQGLLSSTAGQGALADVRQKYVSAAQKEAMNNAQANQQFGVTSALNLYNTLASQELARKSLDSSYQPQFPNQTPLFGDLQNERFLSPTSAINASGPTGDPRQAYWSTYSDMTGATDVGRRDAQVAADNAAARALQQEEMRLNREVFDWQKGQSTGDEDEDDTKWSDIAADVAANYSVDPRTGKLVAKLFSSRLLGLIKAAYGVDIEQEARANNPRAIGIYSTVYPKTWKERLGLVVPKSSTVVSPLNAGLTANIQHTPFGSNRSDEGPSMTVSPASYEPNPFNNSVTQARARLLSRY